jgi:soluble lytic murein transglycosylase-like protein
MTGELSPRGRGRRVLVSAALAVPLAVLPRAAFAGRQVEEPLADSVRTALSAAIADSAPPKPSFADIQERLAYLRWLGAMSDRLRRQKTELVTRVEFLQTLWYESKRSGLEPALLLGLVQVESGFRKYAISIAGARGYTQVMPFWARLIGDGDVGRLFHLQTNLRFGCVILRHYLERERGDLHLALGRYNGSRGRPEYPNAVFAARRLWEYNPADARG